MNNLWRKKPVEIEAMQVPALGTGMAVWADIRKWLASDWQKRAIHYLPNGIIINTLEGDHLASPGDWIIRGVKDEIYPCKPDIFQATYEKV